jgi:hypothetical protein
VRGVFAVGSTVYASTFDGLSISTNGGTSFTNRTTSNGLGANNTRTVFAVGSTVYAATQMGAAWWLEQFVNAVEQNRFDERGKLALLILAVFV